MKTNSEDHAFPMSDLSELGLTKREYFAALAMQGLLSNAHVVFAIRIGDDGMERVAKASIVMANILIKELNMEKK
jgi:hypothetical protein